MTAKTKKTTAKAKPRTVAPKRPPRSASKAAKATPEMTRTAFKVLRGGKSWHGGTYAWPLPTQAPDGSWMPGAWTPDREPVRCYSGYHLTRDPARWWGDGEVTAYLAEYDGATDSTSGTDERDPTKFAVTRARLLRPLTDAELRTHGIYLSGEVEELSSGRFVLGGTVRVKRLCGSARVDEMSDSARVDEMSDSARVDAMSDSARVDAMRDSTRVDRMYGSARVDEMRDSASVVAMRGSASVGAMYGSASAGTMNGSASVGTMNGSARVGAMCDSASVGAMYDSASVVAMHGSASVGAMYGSARVGAMCDSARVGAMYDSASVVAMHGSARVVEMCDSARVDGMRGSASVGAMHDSARADARGDVVVVVRAGGPTVTLSGRASCLDYRPARPVLHVAPECGSLAVNADGTTTLSPPAEAS